MRTCECAASEVAAPAAEVDSRENELVAAGLDETADVGQDGFVGQAAEDAASLGNDAEGTAVRTAFLDLEVRACLGAGSNWRFFEEGVGEGVVGQNDLRSAYTGSHRLNLYQPIVLILPKDRCLTQLERNFGREGFVAVADDGGDARDGGEFFWGALGVATGGDDAGCGVEAMRAADVSAGFAVGFGSDAAGVDDDHIGFGGLAFVGARGAQIERRSLRRRRGQRGSRSFRCGRRAAQGLV